MKYKLIAKEQSLAEAWRTFFSNEEDVEVIEGDLCEQECDAIVSPANSFGFMDGGVDYAISEHLGWHVQDRLQEMIKQLSEGELLIGKALIVETDHASFPYLISAPTMRVPMSFNIATSLNAYLAMKAILIVAREHPHIQTVAIPGLCTGTGRMPEPTAAHQMFEAFKEIEKGKRQTPKTYGEAQKQQFLLNKNGLIWDY